MSLGNWEDLLSSDITSRSANHGSDRSIEPCLTHTDNASYRTNNESSSSSKSNWECACIIPALKIPSKTRSEDEELLKKNGSIDDGPVRNDTTEVGND